MAIEKKLIHFGKLADFEIQLNAGNILDYSIVFIQDAKKIWTHGTYYDCSEAEDISSISWDDVENKPTFATVATSGSYNDLTNKPTIPSAVTESTVSGWGFTKNTGTITGITMNGSSKGTSGVVDLGTVITAHQDISGKQDKLVSGTNIKTINGETLLGSGNITISGGSSTEDIRYFTEFTVEDFIEACETANIITYDTTELFNAMKSNKVVCVPYRGYDKGFIVASYKSGEDEEYPSIYLQKGDIEYYAWVGYDRELVGVLPIYNSVQVVEVEEVGEVPTGGFLDNHIYIMSAPVDYLFLALTNPQKGVTFRFMSGELGTTIEFGGLDEYWANGEIPQIEPNTYYELSIAAHGGNMLNIILTPFKPVE